MVVVFGSAVAGLSVTTCLAWVSLRGLSEQGAMAISQTAILTPVAPTESIAAVPAVPIAALPAASPVADSVATQPVSNWTPPDHNYLFDLSHALQPVEYQRLTSAEQLEMARQIQQWMQSGEDLWSLYQRFDQSYGSSLAGDYDYNREVYIQLAAQHFAPDGLEPLPYPDASPSEDWMPERSLNPDSNPRPMPNWPSQPPNLQPNPQSPQNSPAIPNVIEASM